MNSELLKKAHEKIKSTPVLVNLISKRERELINGAKPLVKPASLDEDKCDIALREVAEVSLSPKSILTLTPRPRKRRPSGTRSRLTLTRSLPTDKGG
jgi:DNA-directed RNA polymerase subunit K/omega